MGTRSPAAMAGGEGSFYMRNNFVQLNDTNKFVHFSRFCGLAWPEMMLRIGFTLDFGGVEASIHLPCEFHGWNSLAL